jgi:hypothetical protein
LPVQRWATPTGRTSGSSRIARRRGSAAYGGWRGDEPRRSAPGQRGAARVPLLARLRAGIVGRRGGGGEDRTVSLDRRVDAAGCANGFAGPIPAARGGPRATRESEAAAHAGGRMRSGRPDSRQASDRRANRCERAVADLPRALVGSGRLRQNASRGLAAVVWACGLASSSPSRLGRAAVDLYRQPGTSRCGICVDRPASARGADRRRPAGLRGGLSGCGTASSTREHRCGDRVRPGDVSVHGVRHEGFDAGEKDDHARRRRLSYGKRRGAGPFGTNGPSRSR